jgi:hypothetical protein
MKVWPAMRATGFHIHADDDPVEAAELWHIIILARFRWCRAQRPNDQAPCPAGAGSLNPEKAYMPAGSGAAPGSAAVVTAGDERYCTVWPPSMTMACPTTKAAASEHSQTTAAAISSGLPIRPTGSSAITFARPSGVPPVKRPIIGVSM